MHYFKVCLFCESSYRLYNKMTMKVILSTAFGSAAAVDIQGGKRGKLFESALTVSGALAPPKENEPVNVFRVVQLVPCKFLA